MIRILVLGYVAGSHELDRLVVVQLAVKRRVARHVRAVGEVVGGHPAALHRRMSVAIHAAFAVCRRRRAAAAAGGGSCVAAVDVAHLGGCRRGER